MPTVKHNALSAAQVRSLKHPGTYTDGNGLTLRIDARGNKRWVQRVTVAGKRRNIGMGSFPTVGLREARQTTQDNLRAIREGRDPIDERRKAREEARRPALPTFREAADMVIQLRRPTWSSDRHAKQWEESLRLHAHPVIGHKPVDEVTTADVLKILQPIWLEKAETSSRVRQRLETVFDYCIVQNWRSDNPASTSIAKALPRRRRLKQHHPALPYGDVPAALEAIRESTSDAVTRLSFEFLVLTASRANEVRGMEWREVDFEARSWEVPSERMKMRRPHRVPLSDRAVEILQEARRLGDGDLAFPNKRTCKPLSNMAYSTLLKRLSIPAVPHGFRASFRSWCLEQTDAPWAVAEAALAHTLGDAVASAYIRSDLFKRRRSLMQDWADFLWI